MGDLFGEIAVSVRELELWLYKVPRLPYSSTARSRYARQFNIAFKIARAKEAGELPDILGDESCDFCGQVLCAEQADILSGIRPFDELALLKRRIAVLEIVLAAAIVPTSHPAPERSPRQRIASP